MKASDRAYSALREEIVEWRLRPGDVLGEVEQAARLGVSRTPLREALARLVADGLAVQQRGRATVVSDVSLDHVDHLFELRRALEVAAARAAARGTQRARFAELATEFSGVALDGPDAVERYYGLAAALDEALDEAAANPYLLQALRALRVHLARLRRLAFDDPARLRASAHEHAVIARAVAAGDPELAASATHLHLHHSLDHIKTHSIPRKDTP
ncbi:GntR family transcriptional regulator [Zafaria sp. Z1313]|uniref:GntR family transcriptional regulator n=1 Tax=unclassified Zafaria TaxID=2828765 RepID=UPI002E7643DC|nr:GntR family transcriptional regulator [Zafaria sp. J156]MEE1622544.1 GntR family transcriptional regulator [Zafaria sp. J156]